MYSCRYLIFLLAVSILPARTLRMHATAFSVDAHRNASGTHARKGTVAADPRVLPLGTRIRVRGAGSYSGTYLVTDTGPAIKGNEIDIYMPSAAAAKRFGSKMVRVQILKKGKGPEDAKRKDRAARVNAFR